MLSAMAEVAAERGAANATVAHVVARSGVSRRTFYDLFEDREDCFMAAFEDALAAVSAPVLGAYRGPGRWEARVRAALAELLGFVRAEPEKGNLLVVESLVAGRKAMRRRTEVVKLLVGALEEGRHAPGARASGAASDGAAGITGGGGAAGTTGGRATTAPSRAAEPPALNGEGLVGAVLAVIHARLVEHDTGSLTGLLNPLMSMIVLPYLGAAAARREAARATPPPSRRAPAARRDPLRDLDMRLTYRTVRVLIAIATHPGASNREVADTAGITDQGQISKLLLRLQNLGLIHNEGEGPAKGEPNAWQLTPKGQEVEGAIREQTTAVGE
jgi:AcrR family transcriptional regulator/DNA-binding MarR family transcriptional regulator